MRKKNTYKEILKQTKRKSFDNEDARDYDTLKDASSWLINVFKMSGEYE